MTRSSKRLLVEGENDRLFFEACCQIARLQSIQVGPPLDIGGAGNGKNNAISLLPKLIEQMEQQTVTHLGLVLDADAPQTDGLGFVKTWDKITGVLAAQGYIIPSRPNKPNAGLCFEHKDGLPPIGLWIMPDNCSNGFLENFIKTALAGTEKKLLERAVNTVDALPEKRFKPHHNEKAEIATYMAWQKSPGQGMHGAVGAKLLNFEKGLAKQYIDWLRSVFAT
jgi:hypothetical protein